MWVGNKWFHGKLRRGVDTVRECSCRTPHALRCVRTPLATHTAPWTQRGPPPLEKHRFSAAYPGIGLIEFRDYQGNVHRTPIGPVIHPMPHHGLPDHPRSRNMLDISQATNMLTSLGVSSSMAAKAAERTAQNHAGADPVTFLKELQTTLEQLSAEAAQGKATGTSTAGATTVAAQTKPYQSIRSGKVSQFPTDGSTLVKSDLTAMPSETASFYKKNPDMLLAAEGFNMDPTLAKMRTDGTVATPEGVNPSEWLMSNKWTADGVVPQDNRLVLAQAPYIGLDCKGADTYRLTTYDSATNSIINFDGTAYDPVTGEARA